MTECLKFLKTEQNSGNDIIFGKNSVTEALLSGKREINKILISKNIHNDSKIDRIKELAVEKGIVFQFCTKEKFSQYAEFNHQGVIAFVSPIKYADLDEFLDKPHTNSSLVILDGIEDPHNFGASYVHVCCARRSMLLLYLQDGTLR